MEESGMEVTVGAERERKKRETEYEKAESFREIAEGFERRMEEICAKYNRRAGGTTNEEPETDVERTWVEECDEEEEEVSEEGEGCGEEETSEEESGVEDSVRKGDAKEAEGLTPSEGGSYASKVKGSGQRCTPQTEIKGNEVWTRVRGKKEKEKTGTTKDTWAERVGSEGRKKERGREEYGRTRTVEGNGRERDKEWQQEMRERRARTRNVVIRGMEVGEEEREERVGKWLAQELGKGVEIEKIWEQGEEKLLIVRLSRLEDSREILERRHEIRERWELDVDRDYTFRERRNRWVVSKRAREERRIGKEVVEEEGRVRVDGTWWCWKEREEEWEREDKEPERTERSVGERGQAEERGLSGEKEVIKKTEDGGSKKISEFMEFMEANERRRAELRKRREDLEKRKEELRKEERALEEEERAWRHEKEKEREREKGDKKAHRREGKECDWRQPEEGQTPEVGEEAKKDESEENEKVIEPSEPSETILEKSTEEAEGKDRREEDLKRRRECVERRKEELREEEQALVEEETSASIENAVWDCMKKFGLG